MVVTNLQVRDEAGQFVRGVSRALCVSLLLLCASVTAEARPYRLLWDANADGLTVGYIVFYGTASGTYQPVDGVDVGNVTEFQVDLTPGESYFFAVRAYDSEGAFGPLSTELQFDVPVDASILVSPTTVAASQTITVTVAHGPGDRLDWVGLYTPGSPIPSYLALKYLNNSTAPPAVGSSGGTVTFTAPTTPGQYVVLFNSAALVTLATSVPITVTPPPPSISTSASSVVVGTTISATVTNSPGASPLEFVGLYPVSAGVNGFIARKYLNDSTAPPATPSTSGTVTFNTTGVAPGAYNMRLVSAANAVLATTTTVNITPVPSLTINNATVTEGNSGTRTLTFTVTLSPVNATQTVTVNFATADGTATAGSDYVATSGTLSFSPSAATRTINVTVNGDLTIEPTESFVVNLSSSVNATISDNQGLGTITTDDVPQPAVNVASTSVTPGAPIGFTVVNGPANPTDWVSISAVSAADNVFLDWMYLNGQKTAPAGGTASATLQFTAPTAQGTYNIRFFSNNTFTRLALSATITVGPAPALTINDVTITEGNAGTSTATFTVTMNPVNPTQTVTVNFATANGTATAGSDYTAANGTVTFPPSTATQTINVTIQGDTAVEASETFFVNLSGATNAAITDPQGMGTIATDDSPPGAAINAGATTVSPGAFIDFTVTGGPGIATDWVSLGTVSAADTGYITWMYLNGLQTVGAGTTSASLRFTAPMTPGTYHIRFFTGSYTRLATSATITVATGPTLTIGDVSVVEGNSGTVTATFTVTLSPANASQTVSVNYATANGTATAGSDYTSAVGTLVFTPSTTTQTLSITVNGDTTVEATETFFVNLSGAVNAAIGDAQATGTITTDDAPAGPSVTLSSPAVLPGGTVTFTVSGGPGNLRDWVAFTQVTAADGAHIDWKYLNGLRTPPATGLTGATLTFTAPMTPGQYHIRFSSSDSYFRLATSQNLTVATGPVLSIGDVSITEGNAGTSVATFTVTLSPVNATQTVTVDYATANGGATAGSDYIAAAGTLTFAPSVPTQTFNVTINGDVTAEPTETFVVNLSNATNALIGDGQATGTITNDDGAAGPALNVASTTVARGGVIQVTVSGGPANRRDWVSLSATSAPDTVFGEWKYLNGQTVPPANGTSGTTLQFTAPMTPGTYNLRFFANDSFTRLAVSATITVP